LNTLIAAIAVLGALVVALGVYVVSLVSKRRIAEGKAQVEAGKAEEAGPSIPRRRVDEGPLPYSAYSSMPRRSRSAAVGTPFSFQPRTL